MGFLALVASMCLATLVIGWLWVRTPVPGASAGGTLTPDQPAPPPSTNGMRISARLPIATIGPVPSDRFALLDQQPAVSESERDSLHKLLTLDNNSGPLTPEQAAEWRKQYQELLDRGNASIPAIREFLKSNIDFSLGDNAQVGYKTARLAMLDALNQIGGNLGVLAMSEVLQSTADPREIAVLGQDLEKNDPGLHQGEVLAAAKDALAMAIAGTVVGRDVAPLFEVFQKFGGDAEIPVLEQSAATWGIYSMMALAQLPNDAGIASLIRFAKGQGASANVAAVEMLGQIAGHSEDARNALVELARQGNLSAYTWVSLGPFLAGNQRVFLNTAFDSPIGQMNPNEVNMAYLPSSGQNFYNAPLGAMTPDQINQQTALVDNLLAVTTDPTGIQQLQHAKQILSQRLLLASGTGAAAPDSTHANQ
jgi:hypothetical protein